MLPKDCLQIFRSELSQSLANFRIEHRTKTTMRPGDVLVVFPNAPPTAKRTNCNLGQQHRLHSRGFFTHALMIALSILLIFSSAIHIAEPLISEPRSSTSSSKNFFASQNGELLSLGSEDNSAIIITANGRSFTPESLEAEPRSRAVVSQSFAPYYERIRIYD